MRRANLALFLLLFPLLSPAEKGQAINVYFENDSHTLGGPGSDNAYSNGFRLSYISASDQIPGWAEPALKSSDFLKENLKRSETNFSVSLGHQIYTPNNTGTTALVVNDRPYAAWLYVGFGAHFKDSDFSEVLELDLGTVGPAAGGSTVQNGFHRIFGIDLVQGWDNQINNEPTVQLSYQQRRRFFELSNETYKTYFDAIPYFGAALGNVLINAHAGGMLRLGKNLPNDFGPTRASNPEGDTFVEPPRVREEELSLYGFAGARGEAVAHNMFLDGNTFRPSHHVHKYPFVFETEFGVGTVWRHWGATWQFVTRSPEFEERSDVYSFASISLSYIF